MSYDTVSCRLVVTFSIMAVTQLVHKRPSAGHWLSTAIIVKEPQELLLPPL